MIILCLVFVSNVLRVREFIPARGLHVLPEARGLTDDIDIQGHMILHVPDLPRLLGLQMLK